jgi:DNA-binding beta-propeller fold protein YncE
MLNLIPRSWLPFRGRPLLQSLTTWGAIALISCGLTVAIAQPTPAQAPRLHGELAFTLDGLDGAEMLAVSADGRRAVVAGGDAIATVAIGANQLTVEQRQTLTVNLFPSGSTAAEITGVAISPDGTFALAGVKDNDEANLATFDEVPGKVVAFSLPDLRVLGSVTVGRGPDSVAIAANGQFAAVANEDEENEEDLTNPNNRPGSISIIDLRQGPAAMAQVEVPIPATGIPFFAQDPQPETVKIAADSSFILATLQENNAVARIEVPMPLPMPLTASAFRVTNFDLGLRTGSGLTQDRVGTGACRASAYDLSLRQEFTSAREPDGIAIAPDLSFFVTADEDNLTETNGQTYRGLPIGPHGARSISAFDARTGAFLGDSGDTIEEAIVAEKLPQRCSSKGPEPEVVSVAMVGDRVIAAVAIERSDAVTLHDVTNPRDIQLLNTVLLNPAIVGADRAAEFEPEGIEIIPSTRQIVVSSPEAGAMSLINLHQ